MVDLNSSNQREVGSTTRTRRDGGIAGLLKRAKVRPCGQGFEKTEGQSIWAHHKKAPPCGEFFYGLDSNKKGAGIVRI